MTSLTTSKIVKVFRSFSTSGRGNDLIAPNANKAEQKVHEEIPNEKKDKQQSYI